MSPISPERWRILSPYLDEGLELPPDRRPAWLAGIGERDPALAEQLQSMLAEHERVHRERFLDRAVLDPEMVARASLAGQVVGAYRLISLIGQGGTGSVWLAERCDGRFEGRAAVKLLNLSLMGRAGEERFKREGTILARFRHPNIAQLADAGVSPGGQPYLVLEYVDGQSIDAYCESRHLSVEARLELFLDVANAVSHAHANLIVHRDIKPANVLVSQDGHVKLLDFGIAKLVEPEAGWDGVTREGGRALTPEYAAPEQLSGGAVTTATDVYALGVLLYVLLTGQHPAGRAIESPATLVKAIVETDPPKPSATADGRLHRTLRGDLDTIITKALKKNVSDRYLSVAAFADDVRRYLRHEAISARPDTLGYRATTFIRRHRGAVSASVAIAVLIAALTVVYTRSLAAERDRAQREASKAIKVSDLMMGLLTSADPYASRGPGPDPTVRDLLDRGADQALRDLKDEPDLQAQMLTMMGRTYRRLGLYDRALPLLEQALASGQRAYGTEHARIADTLHDLGVVYADRGDYAAAGRSLEQALGMRRRVLGPDHPDIAVTLAELGRAYQDQGFNERAEPVHREALELRRRVLGDNHRETPVSLSDVASVLRLKGDLAGAESLLRQCLVLNRQLRGDNHPNTIVTQHDLALITAGRGDFRAAEQAFRTLIPQQRGALGERHPVVAMMLNNLAYTLMAQGRYDESASALDESLDIARAALGSQHQLVAIYMINRGAAEMGRGRADRAEPYLRDALSIRTSAPGVVPSRRRSFPEHDWGIPAVKSLLGEALVAQQRYEEAEPLLLDARRDLDHPQLKIDPNLRLTLTRLVSLYEAWGKRDLAARYRAQLLVGSPSSD